MDRGHRNLVEPSDLVPAGITEKWPFLRLNEKCLYMYIYLDSYMYIYLNSSIYVYMIFTLLDSL